MLALQGLAPASGRNGRAGGTSCLLPFGCTLALALALAVAIVTASEETGGRRRRAVQRTAFPRTPTRGGDSCQSSLYPPTAEGPIPRRNPLFDRNPETSSQYIVGQSDERGGVRVRHDGDWSTVLVGAEAQGGHDPAIGCEERQQDRGIAGQVEDQVDPLSGRLRRAGLPGRRCSR
jgi:hypothetical protein